MGPSVCILWQRPRCPHQRAEPDTEPLSYAGPAPLFLECFLHVLTERLTLVSRTWLCQRPARSLCDTPSLGNTDLRLVRGSGPRLRADCPSYSGEMGRLHPAPGHTGPPQTHRCGMETGLWDGAHHVEEQAHRVSTWSEGGGGCPGSEGLF